MNYFNGTIDEVYSDVIDKLLNSEKVGNTYELQNAVLEIKSPSLNNLSFPKRKDVNIDYCLYELEWYWSANNNCHDIGKHAKMWERISDDGETSNSAYGYILHKKHNKDQIQEIIMELKKNPLSRKAVLIICDPTIDKLATKDLQCTIGLQFLIRNGHLEETVYMRSNDVFYGLPYDYIYFISIGQYIASKLGLTLGRYIHNATSLHLYDRDLEKFHNNETKTFSIDAKSIIERCYHA